MVETIKNSTADLFTVYTRSCEVCNTSFQTCGRGKRCSACLVGPGVSSGDAHITCRVCDRPATVPLDHPALLCQGCLGDLEGTRERVAEWLAAALTALSANEQGWRATLAASPAQTAWERVQAAMIGVAEKRVEKATFDRTWQKRLAEGGALGALLEAYEVYAREADRLEVELARLSRAQAEINAAWLANDI